MKNFIFIVEKEAFEGVHRIAQKVAGDFERVTGTAPVIKKEFQGGNNSVVFATLGKSPLLLQLKPNTSAIEGKREVFMIKLLDDGTLLVAGSDKRGTIYGMFALSEYIGVSPLHFWGDTEPVRCEINITKDIETVSKEPSVKYRGFFINDEWPCFGTWTFGHFKGFTAEMYDHVFELLLRLKGNYLWPAMWTSSFPLDGPDGASEELADIYGVVVGNSHHEPCLRASEEWDKVRGKDSEYGNEWNYYTNKDGLLKYWEDGLKRSGRYEKIITIGMRGERDSSMLGEDASLKDNIDLLKDIIKNQRELIAKHEGENKNPQMLALYKEVEEYFYGGEDGTDVVQGLKDWSELDDVICMLCEDNFGFMRTLPTKDVRERRGGWGMYYHFDYHGGPVSYEWMPSTAFERTWEQMSMAYDYGIRDVWIVNVGDLKFNEVPLAYFLELAYDFEQWGTSTPNSIEKYTAMWLKKTFPAVPQEIRENMSFVLHGYIRMNAMRRPEAQNSGIFHPSHYHETDRILEFTFGIEEMNEDVFEALAALPNDEQQAYYSMIYLPARASINLLRMHLYAGKNRHFANQGLKTANHYADIVTHEIEKDRALLEEFAEFRNGKWKGMELEEHIGFTKWNDDGCRYPLRIKVEPFHKPRMAVSRKCEEQVYNKTYGPPMTIKLDDFMYAGTDEVIIVVANDGVGFIDYEIIPDEPYEWLEVNSLCGLVSGILTEAVSGHIESHTEFAISCNESKLTSDVKSARLLIKDKNDKNSVVAVEIKAKKVDTAGLPPMTFMENRGIIAIEANHFCNKKDVSSGGFVHLENYGRSGIAAAMNGGSGGGMKVYPTTAEFTENDEAPALTYRFFVEESGNYVTEVWTTPTNPVQNKRALRFMLGGQVFTAVPADFRAGSPGDERWCKGVLDNIRITKGEIKLDKGVQELTMSPLEAGLILERLLIYKAGNPPKESYLGPQESWHT